MIQLKIKLWRSAGAAAVLAAAACGAPSGDKAPDQPASATSTGAESDALPAAPAGGAGESGEAGAATVFSGLSGDELTGLRLQHLRGFLLIARVASDDGRPEEASVLIDQGILEAYRSNADQFGTLDITPVRTAADAADATSAQMDQKIDTALAAINAARDKIRTNPADVAARMADISAGLYQGVVQEDFVDPTEYQHSYGAALAAREALVSGQRTLKARDARAYDEAMAEIDAFIALWPSATAPETPSPYSAVVAQSSRLRLALSPYLD